MKRADFVNDGKYATTAKKTSSDEKYQSVFFSRACMTKGSENKALQKRVIPINVRSGVWQEL
jgi:hypothetical protein